MHDTAENVTSILAMYEDGESSNTIAALTGIPSYAVRNILRDNGVVMSGGSRSAKAKAWPLVVEHLPQAENVKDLGRLTGIPYQTLIRWLREEGVQVGVNDPDRMEKAKALAEKGLTVNQISDELGVSPRTVSRMTRTRPKVNRRAYKKEKYWSLVLGRHQEGVDVSRISQEIPVSSSTIERWLRDEGFTPISSQAQIKPSTAEQEVHPRREEALLKFLDGSAASAVDGALSLSHGSTLRWVREEGIEHQGGLYLRRQRKTEMARRLYREGLSLDEVISQAKISYYDLRMALDSSDDLEYPEDEKPDYWCPCGDKTGAPNIRYCCEEHRAKFRKKRLPDPTKQITFNCETCGKEVTRYKGYGSGANKFCSNPCAMKHTKTVKHYVCRESDMVLDSTWEMLFAGLMGFDKIPCERHDRQRGVAWKGEDEGWYAPDFWMPSMDTAVEVKGIEKPDDPEKWDLWRAVYGQRLLVLDRFDLDQLLMAGDRQRWLRGSTVPPLWQEER